MTTLILTVAGADRPGLVAAVADVVEAHGGNWENSSLAELAGTFAGVIEVSVATERTDELQDALRGLQGQGLLTLAVLTGSPADTDAEDQMLEIRVLGNDRSGIVREVSNVLSAHDLSIEELATETRDAAMAGGRLFEASVIARVPPSVDLDALRRDLERIATEVQVDITVA
jgi:glycine cleavage system regulatory protein